MASLPAPSQERGDAADRFEQSHIFNKRHGCAGLLGLCHQEVGQGRLPGFLTFRSSCRIGDLRREDGLHFLRLGMTLLERPADEQFFDLPVGQGLERLLQPDYGQSTSAILMHQPIHLLPSSLGFLLLELGESCGQDILLGSMNIQFHYLHHGDHFRRQLFLKERNHNRISGKDDVTHLIFADNLSQAFHDLFGVFLVRVPHSPLVAGLRPSTDLDSMNLLAFHLLRIDNMAKPEDEDPCCVCIREHGGVAWVLLIETGQLKQIRLVVGIRGYR